MEFGKCHRISQHISLIFLGSHFVSQAQTLLDEGCMEALVNLQKIEWYWRSMLCDYPGHPASEDPQHSVPITLYGISPDSKIILFANFWITYHLS